MFTPDATCARMMQLDPSRMTYLQYARRQGGTVSEGRIDIEGGTQVSKPNWKGLGIVIGALVAFILLQEIIGFMISATLLFFSVAWTLGERKWLRLLLISIAVSVAIYYGFTAGLQLKLPLGFEFLFPAEVEEW